MWALLEHVSALKLSNKAAQQRLSWQVQLLTQRKELEMKKAKDAIRKYLSMKKAVVGVVGLFFVCFFTVIFPENIPLHMCKTVWRIYE